MANQAKCRAGGITAFRSHQFHLQRWVVLAACGMRKPRTPGRITPQRVTPETLRASLGTFSSVPQFPPRSSMVKWLVILSCYSIVKNYTITTESPKLQWVRLNIGTHIVKMRSEGTALTPGRGMATLSREGAVPSFEFVQCLTLQWHYLFLKRS